MDDEVLGALGLIWVLVRVVAVISVWVILFLGVFLGYLTIPLLMLAAFTMLLSIPDLSRRARKITARWRARNRQQ